jgi:hypothetical protein
MPLKTRRLGLRMDPIEEMKRLEKQIGVRDLTPEEIQAMFDKNKEVEELVRQRYPEYFAATTDQKG